MRIRISLIREALIFGGMDGTVCALGIITLLVLTHARPAVIFAGAFAAGLAEFPGMASGQWKSHRGDGIPAALACGLASAAGAVLPACPYLFTSGEAAYAAAVAIGAVLAGAIAWLAPEHGWPAVAETYGVLAAAVVLCVAGGFIHF